MDLTPTAEEAALRDEVRAVAAGEPAVGVRQGAAAALRRPRGRGRVRPRVAGEARERALGRRRLAQRSTAGAARARRALHRHRGARPGTRTGARRPHRREPRRAHAARARHARAEGALAAAHPRRVGDLVPAVQRARSRQRPRRALRTRAETDRRRLAAQRPEGLDELRAVRRLGLVPRAHRSRRAEAAGHLRARRRHARARRRGAAAAPDHRRVGVQRGVLHRRVRARRPPRRPDARRLAHRQLDAHARAGREPAPARRPLATRRRALALGTRAGRARRPPPRAAARGGVRRGEAVPAAQLALDLAHREGAATPGRRAASTSCGGRR